MGRRKAEGGEKEREAAGFLVLSPQSSNSPELFPFKDAFNDGYVLRLETDISLLTS
jgi:hypothetical protein